MTQSALFVIRHYSEGEGKQELTCDAARDAEIVCDDQANRWLWRPYCEPWRLQQLDGQEVVVTSIRRDRLTRGGFPGWRD